MNVVIGQKSVNIRTADILFIKVKHRYVGVVLKYHTRNNLIADAERLACAVNLYILADLDNLTRSLVTECNRNKTEWVTLKFVRVCAANTTAFDLDKNIIISDLGNRKLFNIIMFKLCQHSNSCCFRNITVCSRRFSSGCTAHL